MKVRYESQRAKLQQQISHDITLDKEMKDKLRNCLSVLNKLGKLYDDADLINKQRIVSSTFPEKLIFDGKKSRTPRLNEVLRLALAADKGFRRQKTGQLSKNLELSGQVEIRGSLNYFSSSFIIPIFHIFS